MTKQTARQMWIPDIGYQFRLTEDWEFPLFLERRNDSLVGRLKPNVLFGRNENENGESIGCAIPKGTVLQVDRVFIRQGSSNAWSSITFFIKYAPGDEDKPKPVKRPSYYSRAWDSESTFTNVDPTPQKLKGARFWAKLAFVNEIMFEPIPEDERVK